MYGNLNRILNPLPLFQIQLGMRQMRELGQFLRQRYILDLGFLNARYNGKEARDIQISTLTESLLEGVCAVFKFRTCFDIGTGSFEWNVSDH